MISIVLMVMTPTSSPLAATYIIDEDGKIIYAFLNADYRNRAEPSELTDFLAQNTLN
ncbi:hypothetical protein [Neolewinella agarilytica]|uniref:hypothetical protein n=1 Tax=Neolewinella agarilytica TaxID=478744 RepID=UPI002355CB9F|nr:hypothetical protein [Neolewinella agarilytica]